MRHPAGVTVVLLRSGGTDRRGNPLPEAEHEVQGCAIRPGTSDDIIDRSSGATAEFVVYAPAGTEVAQTDRVRLPPPWGITLPVDGLPRIWRNPFTGDEPGIEIYLAGRQG